MLCVRNQTVLCVLDICKMSGTLLYSVRCVDDTQGVQHTRRAAHTLEEQFKLSMVTYLHEIEPQRDARRLVVSLDGIEPTLSPTLSASEQQQWQ